MRNDDEMMVDEMRYLSQYLPCHLQYLSHNLPSHKSHHEKGRVNPFFSDFNSISDVWNYIFLKKSNNKYNRDDFIKSIQSTIFIINYMIWLIQLHLTTYHLKISQFTISSHLTTYHLPSYDLSHNFYHLISSHNLPSTILWSVSQLTISSHNLPSHHSYLSHRWWMRWDLSLSIILLMRFGKWGKMVNDEMVNEMVRWDGKWDDGKLWDGWW